jgi:hypothetical protein
MSYIDTLTHTEIFQAPAGTVWDLLADWAGIVDWMPDNYIQSLHLEGDGVGAVRHLVTGKGVRLSERLDTLDRESGTLKLSLVNELPWGLLSYRARAELEAISESQCRLTWQGTLEMPACGPESETVTVLLKKSYENMFLGIRRETEKD